MCVQDLSCIFSRTFITCFNEGHIAIIMLIVLCVFQYVNHTNRTPTFQTPQSGVHTVPSSGNYTFFSSAFRASFENVRARNATRCVARRSIENSRSINTYSRSNNLRVIALLSQYRICTLVRYHGNK